jgi:hypothetical protein
MLLYCHAVLPRCLVVLLYCLAVPQVYDVAHNIAKEEEHEVDGKRWGPLFKPQIWLFSLFSSLVRVARPCSRWFQGQVHSGGCLSLCQVLALLVLSPGS